jgi:hypothetical protein
MPRRAKWAVCVLLEWLDQYVIEHRMYHTVCVWLGNTDWWGPWPYPFKIRGEE